MDSALNEALEQINQFAGVQQQQGLLNPTQFAQNVVRRTGPRLSILWAVVVVAVIVSLAVVILLLLKKQRLLQQQQQPEQQRFQQSVLPDGYETLLHQQSHTGGGGGSERPSAPFSSRWSAQHAPERDAPYAGTDENFTPLSQTIGRRAPATA